MAPKESDQENKLDNVKEPAKSWAEKYYGLWRIKDVKLIHRIALDEAIYYEIIFLSEEETL